MTPLRLAILSFCLAVGSALGQHDMSSMSMSTSTSTSTSTSSTVTMTETDPTLITDLSTLTETVQQVDTITEAATEPTTTSTAVVIQETTTHMMPNTTTTNGGGQQTVLPVPAAGNVVADVSVSLLALLVALGVAAQY